VTTVECGRGRGPAWPPAGPLPAWQAERLRTRDRPAVRPGGADSDGLTDSVSESWPRHAASRRPRWPGGLSGRPLTRCCHCHESQCDFGRRRTELQVDSPTRSEALAVTRNLNPAPVTESQAGIRRRDMAATNRPSESDRRPRRPPGRAGAGHSPWLAPSRVGDRQTAAAIWNRGLLYRNTGRVFSEYIRVRSTGIRIASSRYVRHISGICLTYSESLHMPGIYLEYHCSTSMPKAMISLVSMHWHVTVSIP
jgi:hypothetical protein